MAHRLISELKLGERISQNLLVYEVVRRQKKDGSPYFILTLGDKSGKISAILWEEAKAQNLVKDSVVKIEGVVEEWEETPRIKIENITPVDENKVDFSLLLRSSERNAEELLAKLRKLIGDVKNEYLLAIANAFLNDAAFMEQFKKAPASYEKHHAYIGGLLEHTHDVTRIMKALSMIYPDTDSDLMVVGGFLHDVGKIKQYTYRCSIGYSTEGRLIGHILFGYEMLKEKAATIENFPSELLLKLQHMVLSHHGTNEWGSPVEPMFVEAALLHYADLTDSQTNMFLEAQNQPPENEEWSQYVRPLRRQVYLK
jgi:3'-5' exoribonuclease